MTASYAISGASILSSVKTAAMLAQQGTTHHAPNKLSSMPTVPAHDTCKLVFRCYTASNGGL